MASHLPRIGQTDVEEKMAMGGEGKVVTSWDELPAYTGREAEMAVAGEARRRAFRANYVQLFINYGNTVDFQLRQEQVILCEPTIDFLYSEFTPPVTRYEEGSRPELEKAVRCAVDGCATGREAAISLMRRCRDLYQERWYTGEFDQYVFGGTEEQLLEKGEILCECLGRLHVALCEIAGIPGRLIMHVVGGHICSEVYVDGHWAYFDPRCGLYFEQADGSLASVRDLLEDPGLIRAQREEVRNEVSPWFLWEERAWKCEHMYFTPAEVNGYQNYSLSEARRYRYDQKSSGQATADGLFVVNRDYLEAARDAFGLEGDGFRHKWGTRSLRRLPLAYRQDGFSMYFYAEPPMTPESLRESLVDPFRDTNVAFLVWGLGPGSVLCYDTKVGEVYGDGLTEEQWSCGRRGDRYVHENVTGLIRSGHDPLRLACDRARELGIKLIARLEMNHEYGPASEDCWNWVSLVGQLNKQHPEYRLPGSVRLDFRHGEVRDLKLAILREAIEAGADGVSMDLAVYPPFFGDPEDGAPVMTQLIRQVRAMLDEAEEQQGRHLELMVRVPAWDAGALGLDWQTWMKEGLLDYIIPTHLHPNERFDISVDEFISMANRTGVKVIPTLWQGLGFTDTDERPEDGGTGRVRYDKPKTREMFYAQALLFHRAGVHGLQLGMGEMEWCRWPWLDELADPEKVAFADKHYMVNPKPHCPVRFEGPGRRVVPLRIGDDIAAAVDAGYGVRTELVLYCTPIQAGSRLEIRVNERGPAVVDADTPVAGPDDAPLDAAQIGEAIFDREWWRKGERRVRVKAEWWELGENEISLELAAEPPARAGDLAITWVDLLIRYDRPGSAAPTE
ncbi:hypothetical protein ACFL6X_02785 [Candidatus Latescibacterota bacterium]